MRFSWGLAIIGLVAATALFTACGAGEPATTTEAPTTTLAPTTSTEPVTTTTLATIIPGVASELYTNARFGFSLARPASAGVGREGSEGYLPLTQALVASITLPEQLFTGTNLTEAGVFIGASSAPTVTAKWDVPVADQGETAAGQVEINGATFAVFTSNGAAAGNLYEETVYRTLRGGTCYEIAELLHSGEIGNYGPDVKEFDRARFQGYLEAIVHTFTFTAS